MHRTTSVRRVKTKPFLLAFAISFVTCATAANSQQLMKPEGKEIALEGTIRLVHGYGPPGYGETPKIDARVSYWALEVPVPINTRCTPDRPEWAKDECGPAKRMKLFFSGLELARLQDLPPAKWRDRRVVVHGKLHRADTAGEMTTIYMDVINISAPNGAAAH